MRNTTLNKTKSLLAVALSCFMLSACTKTDDKDNVLASGIGTIKVGIQKDIFEGLVNLEKSMSTIKLPLPKSQKSSIRLNDDWQITAELTPEAAEPTLKNWPQQTLQPLLLLKKAA